MRALRSFRTLLFAFLVSIVPASAFAGVFVSINIAPPILPVYAQPVCPGDGYLWTPGYWAYGPAGYFWVPGTWVLAPRPGLLWTPGYWGFGGGAYLWHAGYWGPHVGFYGGVNYGFGYGGVGFIGGRWDGGHFFYNSAVLHVNTTVVRNVYVDRTVIHNTTVINRTSFNGAGGINARPNAQESAAMHDSHFQPTAEQTSHEHFASTNHANFASENGGRPGNPAMSRPMTSPNLAHTAYNNNSRPAYTAGPNSHPGYNTAPNNHPANNNANFKPPANNQPHYNEQPHTSEPAHQGGEQPHDGHQGGDRR
ncbi:MAG: YXWGXW repeat-containing protein [Acidobacteriaceae bacterium]